MLIVRSGSSEAHAISCPLACLDEDQPPTGLLHPTYRFRREEFGGL
jgi:hypothetical protein